MHPRPPRIVTLLLALAALPLCSCGGRPYDPVPLYPAEGRLLVNGEPAAGAEVRLHPVAPPAQGDPLVPVARVGEDGSFELTTYEEGDGAPTGEYAVTVVWPDTRAYTGTGPPPIPPDRLGGRHADPGASTIRVRIEEGPTVLDPMRIEDEGADAPRDDRGEGPTGPMG